MGVSRYILEVIVLVDKYSNLASCAQHHSYHLRPKFREWSHYLLLEEDISDSFLLGRMLVNGSMHSHF